MEVRIGSCLNVSVDQVKAKLGYKQWKMLVTFFHKVRIVNRGFGRTCA